MNSDHNSLIYVLQDPVSFEIRYVGKSTCGIKRAYQPHTAWCRQWINKLKRNGLEPLAIALQRWKYIDQESLSACERYWIAYFRALGCPLTNLTEGGEGICGYKHTEEAKKKVALANSGKIPSAETRVKMSAKKKGNSSAKGVKHTSESRANMAKARIGNKNRLGIPHSPETIEKLREAGKRHVISPEGLKRLREREFTPEHKRLLSEAAVRRPRDEKGRLLGHAKKTRPDNADH